MSGRPSRRRDLWTAQCPRARSTVIALIGLLGILVGEQIPQHGGRFFEALPR